MTRCSHLYMLYVHGVLFCMKEVLVRRSTRYLLVKHFRMQKPCSKNLGLPNPALSGILSATNRLSCMDRLTWQTHRKKSGSLSNPESGTDSVHQVQILPVTSELRTVPYELSLVWELIAGRRILPWITALTACCAGVHVKA